MNDDVEFLQRICKDRVKVRLVTDSKTILTGYVTDVQPDHLMFLDKFDKASRIKLDSIKELIEVTE